MTSKADALTLRSILIACAIIALLLCVRYVAASAASSTPSIASSPPSQGTPTPTIRTPRSDRGTAQINPPEPLRWQPVEHVERALPVEPEIRRALPVESRLPAIAEVREIVVPVPPGRWTRPVEVPFGRRAAVTVKSGKIRIEQNRADTYELVHPPGAFRTYGLNADTRVLRFTSAERTGGEVVVEFLD